MKKPNLRLKRRIILIFGTAEDFAAQIGVHPSIVSRVIRRRIKLRSEDKTLWAFKLGCKPEDIFERV